MVNFATVISPVGYAGGRTGRGSTSKLFIAHNSPGVNPVKNKESRSQESEVRR